MEILVHIGYPKTGSTAIQSHLFTNRNWLLKKRVYVPLTGMASGAGHAYLLGLDDSPLSLPDGLSALQGGGLMAELAGELARARDSGYEKVVLSWEGFSLLTDSAISLLHSALQEFVVTLIVYVREQGALYQSATLQAIKELRYLRKPAVLWDRAMENITPSAYDFSATIDRWLRAFDADLTVHSRLFDKRYLLRGNVVEDFLGVLDLEIDADFALQQVRVNSSLDFFSAAYLETARSLGLDRFRLLGLSRALAATLSETGSGSSTFLSGKEKKHIRKHFAASNARLFEAYRPVNIPSDLEDFPDDSDKSAAAQAVSEDARMFSLHKNLISQPREFWQGEILISAALARVARPPDSGWRNPEKAGVWSVGKISRIAFSIPEVHPTQGPSAIVLTISGTYYGANESTGLRINDQEFEICLRQAELRLELDARVREEGLELLLLHTFPELPPGRDGEPDAVGIAFKLQYLSYSFAWD